MVHSYYYDSIDSSEDPHVFRHQYEQLKETLRFEGQDHLNAQCDVYMQLSEHPAAEQIFREFHRIADEPSAIAINCHRALWMVGSYINRGNLRSKYFTRYLSKVHGRRIIEQATTLFEKDLKRTRLAQEDSTEEDGSEGR